MTTRPWPGSSRARIAIDGKTAKGVNWANIFWLVTASIGATPTVAEVNDLANAMYQAFLTTLWDIQGNDATMENCVANWYGTQPTQVAGIHVESNPGGAGNPTEVDSLAAVISWSIAATWRGGKPRTYMAALPTNAIGDSNTLDSTYLTDLDTAAGDFLTAVNAISTSKFSSVALTCLSFFTGGGPRTPPVAYNINGHRVKTRIDAQRRRLGREVS